MALLIHCRVVLMCVCVLVSCRVYTPPGAAPEGWRDWTQHASVGTEVQLRQNDLQKVSPGFSKGLLLSWLLHKQKSKFSDILLRSAKLCRHIDWMLHAVMMTEAVSRNVGKVFPILRVLCFTVVMQWTWVYKRVHVKSAIFKLDFSSPRETRNRNGLLVS